MRLPLKLTAGILVGVLLTQMVNLALRVERERAAFESDIRKDHIILGEALLVELVEAWRTQGQDAAHALSQRMNAERQALDIRIVAPGELDSAVSVLVLGGEVSQSIVEHGGESHLVTWLPFATREGVVAALRLEESLAPAQAYVRITMLRALLYAGVSTIAATAIAFFLGYLFVGRRVRALVAKARRVGAGDLSGPIVDTGKDELSLLGREFNAMCERLAAARAELEKESAQRLMAEQQLRHADRLSTVGILSAGIAHELGTPLNVVAGRARLVAEAPALPDAVVRNARTIEEQAQRMTRIVRQLLDFARARRPAKAPVDVARLAHDTADMLSPLAGKQGVELAVEDGGGGLCVSADAGQLQQAMTNLVMNAVQASERGRCVHIRVDAAARTGDPTGAEARISVVDEGAGMTDEQLRNVFTPFFTTKDVGEGTGLGLAVAWGLVQENGGHISVHSEVARGSTFIIHLPLEAS